MKTIRDLNLSGKRVIIRVDFNVPIKNGVINDDNRIVESLETIQYAINNGAKVILMSHLGRIKTEDDKNKNTLRPVALRLTELLHKNVLFVPFTRGKALEDAINKMQNGDVLLMENTRFEDLPDNLESGNDIALSKYWASLGDIVINDAFGTSHRSHASNVGIMSYLEGAVGFLVEKEINNIVPVINNPRRPFTVILGGAKVSDKIGVIDNLVLKCDYILIGGGMAYTFLKARGECVGKSIVDDDSLEYCSNLLKKYHNIILPVDHVCSQSLTDENSIVCDKIDSSMMGLDIGPKTISLFNSYLQQSQTVIWNGPMGYFEDSRYEIGTKSLCDKLASLSITSIVGGGDTASCIINMGYKNKFTHVSTGGGASLYLLEGKKMPFIKVMR